MIEDSPAIALLLRRRLVMAGHEVEISATGAAALERLAPARLPDLVMSDVMMPGMDGIETAGRIKGFFPDLPVILVTGQELTSENTSDADAVFGKPIDFDRLLETVDRLSGSRPENA